MTLSALVLDWSTQVFFLNDIIVLHWKSCLSEKREKISSRRHRLEVECGRHAKPESVSRRDRVCRLCSLGAVEDEDHLLLVCPAHHDIRCKFGQQLGKQLTPCSLLTELMCSANQKAVALYLVSCLDNRSVLLKSTM
jgi:hypothetical protein